MTPFVRTGIQSFEYIAQRLTTAASANIGAAARTFLSGAAMSAAFVLTSAAAATPSSSAFMASAPMPSRSTFLGINRSNVEDRERKD
jgi:hypothetical protein